jgi:hypothetical protein
MEFAMAETKHGNLYQLRITLLECHPKCWREVEALGKMKLPDLHYLIQYVMPWENSHLHEFRTHNPYKHLRRQEQLQVRRWSDPEFELEEAKNEFGVGIDELLKVKGDVLYYFYDFGDSWNHEIKVVSVSESAEDPMLFPRCVGGSGMGPPEDCGGVWGWAEMQEALAHSRHERHQEFMEWMGINEGEALNPEAFDVKAADDHLKWLRPKKRAKRKK